MAAAVVVAAAGMLWLVDCHYSVGLERQFLTVSYKSLKVALFWINLSPSDSIPEKDIENTL